MFFTNQSFDAWGRERDPSNWAASLNSSLPTPAWLIRGYTGHVHHREFGLINMNARLYDPVAGRMLSPDNEVQSPDFTQSFNRYSYCFNNPLRYTDPTGNNPWDYPDLNDGSSEWGGGRRFWGRLWDSITKFFGGSEGAVSEKEDVAWTNSLGECTITGTRSTRSNTQGSADFFTPVWLNLPELGSTSNSGGPSIMPMKNLNQVRARGNAGETFPDRAPYANNGITGFLQYVFTSGIENGYYYDYYGNNRGPVHSNSNLITGAPPIPSFSGVNIFNAAKGLSNLTKAELKSILSLESQIAKHQSKLSEYIKNPMKFDNKGFLKNAPSDAIRQKIIQSRINHLKQEIQTFQNNINKFLNGQ